MSAIFTTGGGGCSCSEYLYGDSIQSPAQKKSLKSLLSLCNAFRYMYCQTKSLEHVCRRAFDAQWTKAEHCMDCQIFLRHTASVGVYVHRWLGYTRVRGTRFSMLLCCLYTPLQCNRRKTTDRRTDRLKQTRIALNSGRPFRTKGPGFEENCGDMQLR